MKLLIVEDEPKLAEALSRGLTYQGHAADIISDGEKALTRISLHRQDYDLIILDLMLPSMDGHEIVRRTREMQIAIPILILTARAEIEKKVDLLLSGADDYLVKPFAFAEFLARVQALLRRPTEAVPEIIAVAGIQLDTSRRKVTLDGEEIMLTLKEFGLLEYLMRHPNQVVNREELLSHLWDFDYDAFSNIVDVHVKNLRRKIDKGDGPSILETIRGIGYRIRA